MAQDDTSAASCSSMIVHSKGFNFPSFKWKRLLKCAISFWDLTFSFDRRKNCLKLNWKKGVDMKSKRWCRMGLAFSELLVGKFSFWFHFQMFQQFCNFSFHPLSICYNGKHSQQNNSWKVHSSLGFILSKVTLETQKVEPTTSIFITENFFERAWKLSLYMIISDI